MKNEKRQRATTVAAMQKKDVNETQDKHQENEARRNEAKRKRKRRRSRNNKKETQTFNVLNDQFDTFLKL